MQFVFGVVVTTGSMLCDDWLDVELYVLSCEQKEDKKPALEDALKLTSNNLPQDLIKITQPRKRRLSFFLKNVPKKRGLSSPRDCLDTELNNNARLL